MFKILIVEDNPDKADKIKEILMTLDGKLDYVWCEDCNSAKTELQSTQYDLIILDISLPREKGGPIIKYAGVNLLNSIYRRSEFKKPHHIVGITKYDDVLNKVTPIFLQKLIYIIRYKENEIEWENQLVDKITYLVQTIQCTSSDIGVSDNIVEKFFSWAKRKWLIASIIIIGIIVIGVGSFTDSFQKIGDFFESRQQPGKAKKLLNSQGVTFSESEYFKKVRTNDTLTVKEFLRAGISPNCVDENGQTALVVAIKMNFKEMATTLINDGANLNSKLMDGGYPIDIAIKEGRNDILKTLLAEKCNIRVTSDQYPEPIIYSLMEKNYPAFKQILVEFLQKYPKEDLKKILIYKNQTFNNEERDSLESMLPNSLKP